MKSKVTLSAIVAALLITGLGGCGRPGADSNAKKSANGGNASANDAASRTYVEPGKKDEFYLFYSGGHSGQVFVAGIPSMRHMFTIPVFAPHPGVGYGFDEETKHMLGGFSWGDVHHPALSQTASKYDGRWLFVNDNANNRVARIDLRDMKTKQILGPIPNSSGNHGSSFVTENTEYILVATRFSVPLPKGRAAPIESYADEFKGMVSGITVDKNTGEMKVGWQILTPPFNWDLGSTGKGPSSGWAFWTSYNTEMAYETLEAGASQLDRDLAAVVNWRAAEAAVRDGKATDMDGVPVIDPAKVPGVLYFLPVPKSPHGIDVDPSGKWIAAGGKLQPTIPVFDFEKIKAAIDQKNFETDFRGIPVIKYDAVLEGEVPGGLGPLHTQYDGKGNAYTSMFIESVITKWKMPPWTDEEKKDLNKVVLDKIPVHFNIGHLVVAGSDTVEPYGRYMVAGNKLSKGRHLSTGPSQPESSQLIDITGEKMVMLYETFTDPEPHFMQILKADAIKPIEVYPRAENKHPHAIWDASAAEVTRNGTNVVAKVMAIRSRFVPDKIEVNEGDTVELHLTNVEQTSDMIHGWALIEHDVNIIVDPGETKTVKFKVGKSGVFAFYCTNFCSALHQEMQGYMVVKPAAGRDAGGATRKGE
jgi:nitrous-oxide reductase